MSEEVVSLMKREATFAEHKAMMNGVGPGAYGRALESLVSADVEVSIAVKGWACALLWSSGETLVVSRLLATRKMVLPEVVKMLKVLDGRRLLRQLMRKIEVTSNAGKLSKLQAEMRRLENESLGENTTGASGALMKRVRAWCGLFSVSELEFFLAALPPDLWKELADLVHPAPSDFALKYFLPCIFGAPAPEGSLVQALQSLESVDQLPKLFEDHPGSVGCYSFIRQRFSVGSVGSEAAAKLAEGAPLEDVLWFYEEITQRQGSKERVDATILKRLQDAGDDLLAGNEAGRSGRTSYGKLIERLLLFSRKGASFTEALADLIERSRATKSEAAAKNESTRVAVIADASASMQCAIDAAAIVASAVSSSMNASLTFFNSRDFKSSLGVPRTVMETVAVAKEVKASGSTAPATSLWPFYRDKVKTDLFVVVTDEMENGDHLGRWQGGNCSESYSFARLFQKYLIDVEPRALVFFVSFLQSSAEQGQMVKELSDLGLGEKVRQFRFDPRRPDLSKLTTLLGLISLLIGEELAQDDDEDNHDWKNPKVPGAVVAESCLAEPRVDEDEQVVTAVLVNPTLEEEIRPASETRACCCALS